MKNNELDLEITSRVLGRGCVLDILDRGEEWVERKTELEGKKVREFNNCYNWAILAFSSLLLTPEALPEILKN